MLSYLAIYILNINPLSAISFANIFSDSTGFLFILSMISFVVQKLLSVIRSHLFIFAFTSFGLENIQKNVSMIYIKVCPTTTTPMFLLGLCFQVLYFGL